MTDGSQLSLTAEEAITYNRKAVALLSNLNGWPEMYDEWSWTADQCECKLPMDILDEKEQKWRIHTFVIIWQLRCRLIQRLN